MDSAAALWAAVAASGLYHGINPGMGWPLAVSAALMERRAQSLWRACLALAVGHLLAMLAMLLPFSALVMLVAWQREIQIAAALLLILAGGYLLINRRHPRFLARVPPSRLALWSFLVALAHGAGLMLVPIYLGLCDLAGAEAGHAAAGALMGSSIGTALWVALIHTLCMTLAGGALAWGVYRWIGLEVLSRGWLNLDLFWALSLAAMGILSLILVL